MHGIVDGYMHWHANRGDAGYNTPHCSPPADRELIEEECNVHVFDVFGKAVYLFPENLVLIYRTRFFTAGRVHFGNRYQHSSRSCETRIDSLLALFSYTCLYNPTT